jgi:hypothetical protein
MCKLAEYDVELSVGERQFFRVSLPPLDIYRRNYGILASTFQELRREIDSTRTRSHTGGSDGYHTCAAANVEDPRSATNASVSHEARRRGRCDCLEGRKMRPTFSLRLLKFCELHEPPRTINH